MSIVISGLGRPTGVLVTWGYGDLLIELISPFTEIIGVKFIKLNSKIITFTTLDNTTAVIERIIAETSDDLVVNPPDSGDLQVIPTVSVSYGILDGIKISYDSLNPIDAFISRVVSEEPIVQVKNPSGGDLQIIPTTSVSYEKQDGIAVNHEISDKVIVEFIRIVAEEN